jgi:hypothetical protein
MDKHRKEIVNNFFSSISGGHLFWENNSRMSKCPCLLGVSNFCIIFERERERERERDHIMWETGMTVRKREMERSRRRRRKKRERQRNR